MSEITRVLWVRIVMACAWVGALAGGMAIVDPDAGTAALGVVLVVATATFSMVRPLRLSHYAFAGAAAAAYAMALGLRSTAASADPDAPYLPAAALGAFGIALTALVGDQIRRSLVQHDRELTTRARLIDELETFEVETGAVKRSHAERLIREEVERARRYGRQLALVVLGPDRWDDALLDRGAAAAEELVAAASRAYIASARPIDRVIHIEGPDFAVLLPETDLDGAQIAAEKLGAEGATQFGVVVRAGVAAFPDGEANGPGLLAEAEQALSFARLAQIPVASRELLLG